MNIDLAKDLYRESWARHDQLTSGVGTPITVMSAVGGAIALMIRGFAATEVGVIVLFGVTVSAAVVSLVAAAKDVDGYLSERLVTAADKNAEGVPWS